MINGLKAQRRLALYVALGLSAGSGVFLDASAAYANEVKIPSTDTAHVSGINGTTETGSKGGNQITIGEAGGGGPVVNGDVVGGYAAVGDAANNNVTIESIVAVMQSVYGGKSDAGAAVHNAVHIKGGSVNAGAVYGGYTAGNGAVQNNTVTLAGGTVSGNVIAGASAGRGSVTGNTIRLGDESHRDLTGAGLSGADLRGAETNGDAADNVLEVNAKNVTVNSVGRFDTYRFNLGNAVGDGDTMLQVVRAGAFDPAGDGVSLGNIKVGTIDQQGHGQVTLLKGQTAATQLKFDASVYELAATVTHELELRTDSNANTANALLLNYNRFNGGRVTHDGTAAPANGELYGGLSRSGHTTANNELSVNHLAANLTAAFGGKNQGAQGDVIGNRLTVAGTSEPSPGTNTFAITSAYGGAITNAANGGTVGGTADGAGNTVAVTGGTVTNAYGGYTAGSGAVQQNAANIAGGTLSKVYGGYSAGDGAVQNNAVTITGGTIGSSVNNGMVYGGYAEHGTASGNAVILGGADGTYNADLSNANLYGGYAAAPAETVGNTLHVRAKDITVKSVQNFDRYQFHLNPSLSDRATMLTVTNGGFNQQVKWANFDIADTSNLQGNPLGRVTLMRAQAGNDLTFDDYARRDRSTENIEYVMETDTGNGTAQAVNLAYAQYRNNTWEYNGTNPAVTNEVFGGISYIDGHTTENNTIAVSGVPAGSLGAVYGGKTNGAANSKNNRVIINGTNVNPSNPVTLGQINTAYGGYTAAAAGAAEDNEVRVQGGKVGTVYGGASAVGTQGTASKNRVTITGGGVTGQIAGGRTYNAAQDSHGNIVTLGVENGSNGAFGANVGNAAVYGTSYYDEANHRELIFANDSSRIAGNTLNVTATGASVKTVRNFEKFNFRLGNSFKDGDAMLTLTEAGGFGTVTASSDNVRVKWENAVADTAQLSAVRGQGIHGRNTITLLQTVVSDPNPRPNDLRFSGYTETDYADLDRVYEKKLHTDTSRILNGTDVDANAVLLELNRYRDDTVTHNGAASPAEVYGGYSAYDHTERDADGHEMTIGHTTEGNVLNITGVAGGTNNLKAYGGYTGGTQGGSVNNYVHVDVRNANPGSLASVYGGYTKGAGIVRGNTVRFSKGTVHDLAGGYIDTAASSADVTSNTVAAEGGSIGGTVYGGYTKGTGRADNNTVTLGNVTVGGDVFGGYSDTAPAADVRAANHNTVNLYGTTVNGIVFGGAAKDTLNNRIANGIGNTLAVYARGTKAADFKGVQNLRFYLPEGTVEDPAAETMLRLTKAEYLTGGKKDLTNINIGVALSGARPSLSVGDTVSLMKAYRVDAGNSTAVALTSDTPLINSTTGMQGVSLHYGFDLLTREAENEALVPNSNPNHLNNELIARVTSVGLNEQTKSLVETRAATMAFINSSADLLTESGFNAAIEAASAAAGASGQPGGDNGFEMWAAQSGSSIRLNSGSHVDAKGWNLNLGFAKQKTAGRNTITYGPFVEYGRGTYDSYLDDGTHGDGKISYFGAGVMAKSKSVSGAYVEGSLRAGRVKSDYAGNISGTYTDYDNSSAYYAAHVGVGQEKELKGGSKIDTYAKYFYAHQNGNTTKLRTGESYDFDEVNSHRLRVGARYTKKLNNRSELYTGLAYEYEFGSDARATYQGYSTPSPSLKGGTGILELGYRFSPKDGRVSYGVHLMGMTGKREGVVGGVQVNWAF